MTATPVALRDRQAATFVGFWEELFHYPAPVILVCGRMGTGKTDFSLLLAEMALMYGWVEEVATNIKVDDPRFTQITSLSALEAWLNKDTSRKLFILDEAGIHIDARNPLSAINRKFRHMVFLLRKKRAKLIVVTQRWEDIDAAVRDLILCLVFKISKQHAVIESFVSDDFIEVFDVPKTSIRYDTYDVAEFHLVGGATPVAGEGWACECGRYFEVYNQTGSYKKAGEILGVSHETVRRMVRQHISHVSQMLNRGEDRVASSKGVGKQDSDFLHKNVRLAPNERSHNGREESPGIRFWREVKI